MSRTICFRRREIKSVRKSHASQATSSDKLFHFSSGACTGPCPGQVITRARKLENGQCEKKLEFAELKRKFPSLNTKDDDELLHDKERAVKKPKTEAVWYVESLFH